MEKKLYDIVAAKINNEFLSDEELSVLKDWLDNSPENKQIYYKLKQWNALNKKVVHVKSDHREIWVRILRKKRAIMVKQRCVFILKKISAAAVFLLLIGGAFLLIDKTKKNEMPHQLVTTHNEIKLELANGEKIVLDPSVKSVAVDDNGTQASCDANLLSYKTDIVQSRGESVKYNRLIVPTGAEYQLVLSDSTRVYMNAGSELRYPIVFPRGSREVYLKGEAYFEVQPDTTRTFVVKTDDLEIQVLGTSFNVNAYSDVNILTATLISGKVKAVYNGKYYELVPGEQIYCDRDTKNIFKKKVNTLLYTSWKDGYYYFEAMRLEDIMQMLSRWYGFKVFFQNSSLKDIEFSGRIQRYEDVSRLFQKFEKTEDVSFVHKDGIVVVGKQR